MSFPDWLNVLIAEEICLPSEAERSLRQLTCVAAVISYMEVRSVRTIS